MMDSCWSEVEKPAPIHAGNRQLRLKVKEEDSEGVMAAVSIIPDVNERASGKAHPV